MRRSTQEWVAEILSLTILIGSFIYLLVNWGLIPDKVPTHFGFSGKPDAWGQKTSLWILPSINLLIWVVLTVASRSPSLLNIPFTIDRNHPVIQRILVNFSIVLKLIINTILGYITVQSARVAMASADGMGNVFILASILILALVMIFYQSRLKRTQQAIYDEVQ